MVISFLPITATAFALVYKTPKDAAHSKAVIDYFKYAYTEGGKAAEALDCQLVYAIVPKDSLDATVRKQARKAAEARLRRISHTMSLEAQGLRKPELEAELDRLTDEILRTGGSRLWEDA